ncbi:TATA box-binding protein-associated factor RNA polymerase I subunit B isoform X2 [Phalaenopsis equestris]|uniref:TATA box-binding protein-associated factor RNA polymerase I subunit B isoform X2 n=1 Tax=Phalaenopsis equestris TaxID=78828 RepID=UPI0009E34DA4|nr:TATA box-binding protein-associated factor RNA polymerase I subunit B isoform X2 [Phalaenopsis equestris]
MWQSTNPKLEMESPQWKPDNHRSLFCDVCGCEDFGGGDDGFFYCSQCGSQSQNVADTQADADDIYGGDGGVGAIYSIFHHRAKGRSSRSPSKPNFKLPSKEEVLRSLTQAAADSHKKESVASLYGFEDGSSSPQDFGSVDCRDTERAAGETRLRYVQGLQLMLQLQCEALVEKFGVSPLICGMAMPIWLRYVAVSRVFDDGWFEKMVSEAEAAASAKFNEKNGGNEKQETQNEIQSNLRTGQRKTFGQKVISISFRSLRKLIPVHSTLVISFLSCHLAREAVLPTDIYQWVSEAKLPYLSAFAELGQGLGPPKFCPLSARLMFRPIRVISASLLEATSASIAQTKILPHACRLYEWSLPSELWLSSCHHALPTRVYVMAILIVAIRILYNIQGHGIWETSLSDMRNSTSLGHKHLGAAQEDVAREPSAPNDFPCVQNSEFCAKELLQILDTAYHRMGTTHEYSKDLRSYLKYCVDVIFAGLAPSYEEGKLIERLWDIYDKKEDEDQHTDEEAKFFELKVKRPRDEEPTNLSSEKEAKVQKQNITQKKVGNLSNCSTGARNPAIEQLKVNMEDNGFQYIPPRGERKKADGYLHYRRQKINANFIYVAHADYYILLRACAKLAQVDARVLHIGVLKFEKRLHWIEHRADQSLNL